MVIKVDQFGTVLDFGRSRSKNKEMAVSIARQHESNRALTHAVTGRLSSGGGVAQVKDFKAVRSFADVDVATGTIGGTKATTDASLALVNDALDALFFDANAVAAVLGIAQVVYAGGGTKASPINAITGAGVLAVTGATAAVMNPIRVQIDKNMHTVAALYNKIARAVGHEPVFIHTNPYLQPPPDTYDAGGTGLGGGTSAAGTGVAFGKDAPFTDPTPAITEDSGAANATGTTKAAIDAALDIWRNNVETLATRLAVVTNSVVVLTVSTGGVDGTAVTAITVLPADDADLTAPGNEGPTEATLNAEIVDIKNSISSLFTKANALAEGLGVPQVTHDGGGTASDTLPAIGTSGADAATGPLKANMDPIILAWETSFDTLAEFINDMADVVDVPAITRVTITSSFPFDNPVNALQEKSDFNATQRALSRFRTSRLATSPGTGAIDADGGAYGGVGQLNTTMDAMLVEVAATITTLGNQINSIRTALANPLVKIV